MTTINKLKSHLSDCEKILNKFIEKYKINKYYFHIEDTVSINTHKNLNMSFHNEFDNKTIAEVNNIKGVLYESFRKYLEVNKIEYKLIITTSYVSWHVDKIIFKFEIIND